LEWANDHEKWNPIHAKMKPLFAKPHSITMYKISTCNNSYVHCYKSNSHSNNTVSLNTIDYTCPKLYILETLKDSYSNNDFLQQKWISTLHFYLSFSSFGVLVVRMWCHMDISSNHIPTIQVLEVLVSSIIGLV